MPRSTFYTKLLQRRGTRCRHTDCTSALDSISPYCTAHRKRVERYGHPDGRAIRAKEYAVERQLVASFLQRHADHEAIKAGLQWLRQWMDDANMSEDVPGQGALQRLYLHGVEPLQILTVAAALFLFSRLQPRHLPDDDRLTFQIGYQVLCLAPRAQRYSVCRGKPRMVSEQIGKVDRRTVGRRIRLSLAPLFVNLVEAVLAEEQKRNDLSISIRKPFAGNT